MRERQPRYRQAPLTNDEPSHSHDGPRGRYVERQESYVEEREEIAPYEADEREVTSSSTMRYPSLSQIVALAIGVVFLVLGGIALARVGFGDLSAETTIAGVPHTALLGIIHVAFGALMVLGGATPGTNRGLMALLGALALAWGIMVVIEPNVGGEMLGMSEVNGWLYVITGVVALTAGIFAPGFIGTRVVRRWRRTDDRI